MAHDGVSIRFVAKGLRQQSATVKGGRAFKFLFALSRRVFVNLQDLYSRCGFLTPEFLFALSRRVFVNDRPARGGVAGTERFLFALSRRVFVNEGHWTLIEPFGCCFYSLCREGSSSTGVIAILGLIRLFTIQGVVRV